MFSSLNSEQKKAVFTTRGKILVLAGAGSGKTGVLACRIAYLIEEENIPPEQILGLTFTNKAAKEMQERVAKFVSREKARRVTLCTFHGFCMQLLRKEIGRLGFTPNFTLYDEKEVKRVLMRMVRHSLEHDGELPSLQTAMEKISKAKNLGIKDIEEEDLPKESWFNRFGKDLATRFDACMRSYNAVDFDGLLSQSVTLLEEHPEVAETLQERYRHILIDEYQDTNPIQYKLADLLSKKHGNLCVVGDDDQSIYGWRGAEIKNILRFPSDILIKLEQNYRSTSGILQAANRLIAHNGERHAKELWTQKTESPPIFLFHAPNEIEEAVAVAQRILWYRKEKNLKWKDIAILYRSNALSKNFETALLQTVWEDEGTWKRGIPYEVFGGTEFYERSEIKDVLAYLRVMANPRDEEALLRIINTPRRAISERCLEILTQYNRNNKLPLWEVLVSVIDPESPLRERLSAKTVQSMEDFVLLMEKTKRDFQSGTAPLHTILEKFLHEIDYDRSIREEVKSEKMRAFKKENVLGCIEALSFYEEEKKKDSSNPVASLQDFLSTTLLDPDSGPKSNNRGNEDKVRLMTIHSAKGLEFEACFVVCLEEKIIPHEKSLSAAAKEEERRLLYVALTRAKRYLTLSMSRERKKMGKPLPTRPSEFLFEIPPELLTNVSYQTQPFD